ncbi:MAG: bifunctional 4-hydroxy-2-oxoglutarate aldolase/2-dehydro-3-deoxy-phosphogluconate aldolase [Saprospiraceae bacterium]
MIKRSPMDKFEITKDIYESGLVPLFYQPDLEKAKVLLKACYDAGLKTLEFTNRAAFAHAVFTPLNIYAKKELPGMRLGIGTVTDVGMAAMYLQSGADFIVMPSLQEEVIALCNKRKVLCIPGCGSVTEISRAETLGCELVKLFPGNHFGPKFISDVLGPMPWTSILVSGGVEPVKENIQSWIKAGATCLALGSKLFTPEVLNGDNLQELTNMIQSCMLWVKEARKA